MDPYQETFNTYNKIADIYLEKFMELDIYNESYDFFCQYLENPTAKILELGCGPGNISKYLLSQQPTYQIFGIDMAPNMIDLAKQQNPTATYEMLDCRDIHRIKQKFNGVIGGFCLPYLSPKDCYKLFADVYILLEDQGIAYFSLVEGSYDLSGYKIGNGGRVFFYYHSLEGFIAVLKKLNFELLQVLKIRYTSTRNESEIHTIFLVKKNN